MMSEQPSKNRIADAFGRKASLYHEHARIQHRGLEQLSSWLKSGSPAGIWADLGCGPGTLHHHFGWPKEALKIISVDISQHSLHALQKQDPSAICLNADIEQLSIKPTTLDGIILASVLQWTHDPAVALKNLASTLRPAGSIFYAVFVETSFCELYSVRKSFNLSIPTQIPSVEQFNRWLEESDLTSGRSEILHETEWFKSALDVLRSLGAIGGTAVTGKRLSTSELKNFCLEYENRYATEQGVPITYSLLLGTALRK